MECEVVSEEEEVDKEEEWETSFFFGDLIKTEDITYFWMVGDSLVVDVSDSFLGRMVMVYLPFSQEDGLSITSQYLRGDDATLL